MKMKCAWTLTVGSHWGKIWTSAYGEIGWPECGEWTVITIPFETDGKDIYKDARKALDEYLNYRADFHIWYWFWFKDEVE